MELLVNNATTTLNGGINNSVTSVVVTSGAVFPATGNFRILVDTELMLVTARSSDTLTVTRGIEGTAAASHSDLAAVSAVLTAAGFRQYLSDHGLITYCLGDLKPTTPGTYDEEFEGVADTLPSNWSWASAPSGSDDWFLNSRWPSLLTIEGTGNTTYTLTRASFTPGAGDFGLWFKLHNSPAVGSNAGDFRCYIKNSGGTEGRAIEWYPPTANGVNARTLKTISSVESAWSGTIPLSADVSQIYFGLTRTSGNVWSAWMSNNGVSWQRVGGTETHSFTVDKIEFIFQTTAAQSLTGLDWVRSRADVEFPRP